MHRRLRTIVLFSLLIAVLMVGCTDRSTVNITQPYCSTIIIDGNGVTQTVSGSPGGSVTIGDTTYNFGPDCRVTTTTTTTTTTSTTGTGGTN